MNRIASPLRLSRRARVFSTAPDCIYWITETDEGMWRFPSAGAVASFLESDSTTETILANFAPGGEREQAGRALRGLIRRGLVEPTSAPENISEILRESGIVRETSNETRWQSGVALRNLATPEEGEALREAFSRAGVRMSDEAETQIVVVDDYLDPRLAMRKNRWALVKLAGEEIRVGPLFSPEGTPPCWRCLQLRLRETAWLSSQVAPEKNRLWTPYVNRSRFDAAAAIASEEIIRWLLGASDLLEKTIWSFRWATLEASRHALAHLPDCPDCRATTPARVQGTSPRDPMDRLEALTSPITGILRDLERRDLASSPPVFTFGAIHNVALPPAEMAIPGAILEPGVCSGRGWTAEQARSACIAEAVERYSIQFRGDEPRRLARFRDLGEAAIHPNRVLLFSERQFAAREDWNRRHSLDDAVPESFDEDEPVEWYEGWSVTGRFPRFLPLALVSQYYRPGGRRFIGDADSSGCAAGATLEQALLHALLELVERDARAIWWFNRVALPAFPAAAIADPHCRRVCANLEDQGWTIRIHNITTDLDIPVFVAVAQRSDGWIRGSGAHPDAGIALARAVCELWQLSKTPPKTFAAPPSGEWLDLPLAAASSEEREVDPNPRIEECCAKIARAGYEVIAFDQTRPEIAFPVVRVIAPGLRPAKPRFAPGRLYDLPLRLKWSESERSERELPEQSA